MTAKQFVYIVPPTREDVNTAAAGAGAQLQPVGRQWISRHCSGQRLFNFRGVDDPIVCPIFSFFCVLFRALASHSQEQRRLSPLFEFSRKNNISLVLSS